MRYNNYYYSIQRFLKNYNHTLLLLAVSLCGYMILTAILGYKENLAPFMILSQFIVGLVFIGALFISKYIKSLNQLLFCIFVYNVFFSFYFRILFLDHYGMPYGLAVDSYSYDQFGYRCQNSSFNQLVKNVFAEWDIDDIGYSLFTALTFKLFGVEVGRWVILLCNSIFVTIASKMLYVISDTLFGVKKISCIASAMWGFFPFMLITTSVGLKENVFCTIIMSFWYCAYKYFINKGIFWFALSLIFILLTFTFRTAITLMLLLSFIVLCLTNKNNRKSILRLLILSGVATPIFASLAIEKFTGISMEQVIAVAEHRNASMGASVSGNMIQTISAFIGPFPNFNRLVQYGLYHSSGLLLKGITSVFCVSGIYYIIKSYDYRFYPILLYWIFGIALLILGGVALDMRYAITFYMAYVILACYGLSRIKNKFIIAGVQLSTLAVILLYNFR